MPLLEYTIVFASDVVDVDMKEAGLLLPALDEDADEAEVGIEEDRLLDDEDGEEKSSFKFIAVNTDVGLTFGFLYQPKMYQRGEVPKIRKDTKRERDQRCEY